MGTRYDGPVMMSIAQASRYSGLSRYVLNQAIAAGALTTIRIPGCQHPRLRREEVDALMRTTIREDGSAPNDTTKGQHAMFYPYSRRDLPPVGGTVQVCGGVYCPPEAIGRIGTVVEAYPTLVAVRFADYPNTVDYQPDELQRADPYQAELTYLAALLADRAAIQKGLLDRCGSGSIQFAARQAALRAANDAHRLVCEQLASAANSRDIEEEDEKEDENTDGGTTTPN